MSILEELFTPLQIKFKDNKKILNYLTDLHEWDEQQQVFMSQGRFDLLNSDNSKLVGCEEYSSVLLIIDKLAMAYLKSGDYPRSLEYIDECHNNNLINDRFKYEMKDKLQMLQQSIKHLPISKNLKETKIYFLKILSKIKKEEHSLFITIFTAVVAQNEINYLAVNSDN